MKGSNTAQVLARNDSKLYLYVFRYFAYSAVASMRPTEALASVKF